MLVFDQLKKNDPQLRLLAVLVAVGFFVLLVGLWWVQVVSSREYEASLVTQAYRTIRVPSVRGKILDCEGRVLAENRPRYNLSLYLGELAKQFKAADTRVLNQALKEQTNAIAAEEKKLGRPLTKLEKKAFAYTTAQDEAFHKQARDEVAAAEVARLSRSLGQEIPFDAVKFNRHYARELAMPFPVLENLTPAQIARFQENFTNGFGADLELQSMRFYPYGSFAAHVLGELQMDDRSDEGEESFFNYRLPDYRGVTGIERGFNEYLQGRAGHLSVMINNMGYRQAEDVDSAPEPGANVVLTLDADLQQSVERALAAHRPGANTAAVVMDVNNGDILALASTPVFDPNDFAQPHGISSAKYEELQQLSAEKNRATQERYAPGSTFKVVVGLAALENGWNPEKQLTVEANPEYPGKGIYRDPKHRFKVKDTVPPGEYDFNLAIELSSNSYFVQVGLLTGIDRIIELAQKFHFGEKCNLPTHQETGGDLPTLAKIHHGWSDGDTANVSIGQGAVDVTPLQMAVAYSAIANGGTVYWPRLVSRIEPQDPARSGIVTNFPAGRVHDHLGVSERSLRILYNAMLGETEDARGSGRNACVSGLRICGKTGTAQVQDAKGDLTGYNFWFASFAPYESPKYAVVIMVQSEVGPGSGGVVCAPIAHDIYATIVAKEKARATSLAAANPRKI